MTTSLHCTVVPLFQTSVFSKKMKHTETTIYSDIIIYNLSQYLALHTIVCVEILLQVTVKYNFYFITSSKNLK